MIRNYWMHPSFYLLPNEMENPTQNCRIDTIILIASFNVKILFSLLELSRLLSLALFRLLSVFDSSSFILRLI